MLSSIYFVFYILKVLLFTFVSQNQSYGDYKDEAVEVQSQGQLNGKISSKEL